MHVSPLLWGHAGCLVVFWKGQHEDSSGDDQGKERTCGVQRYMHTEHHPLSPLTFPCTAHIEPTHARYPKTHFLASGVQRYVRTERHP